MRGLTSVAVLLALCTVGCDNSGGDSSVTSPSAVLTTDTFVGTVPLLDTHDGFVYHTFTVAKTGEVDVTLTAAGPPATISMGLGLGSPPSTGEATCALFTGLFGATPAGSAPQIVVSAQAGTYCVAVFDFGNALAPIAYSITVAHP